MKIKLHCLFLLMMFSFAVRSQNTVIFSGKITDAESNPINGAFAYLLNTNFSVFSNAQGEFSLRNIPVGNYTVQISARNYATITMNILLQIGNGGEPLSFQLKNSSRQLDAVVVTAQKTEESLQNIPFTITAISSKQVQDYRLWNSKDITAIVPNLNSANPGDDRNVTSIRGITSTSYDPAVATYIDGVSQFGLDTYIAQLSDIERIEILKGPQGTLYGRNAMGGVINIITKQPTNATNGFAEINIGNYNQQRFCLGVRTPLVKNKFFAGVSGTYDSRDGFYTNQFDSSSFDKQYNFTGNYYLKYIANAKWAVMLNAKHTSSRNNGTFPMVIPDDPDHPLQNPFVLNQNSITKMVDNILNTSLSVNYFGTHFNFSSQSAYQSDHRYYTNPIDGDFSPADIVSVINNYDGWNKVQVLTQEFKFSSPAATPDSLRWTAGSFLFYNDNPVKQATHFGADAALFGAPPNSSVITTTKGKSFGAAFYGQVTYALTRKLEITGGVRFDYENKKYSVLGEYQQDPDPNPFVTLPDTNAKVNFSAVSQRFGLGYSLTETNNLFFTCSRGYRAGGLTQLSSDPSQPPLFPYKPEYSTNLETGIKNNFFDNRLRFNIAAFITYVNDAQVPTFVLPEAITVTKNAGKLRSTGIETEIATTPVKGVQVEYNFGYSNAEYTTLKLSQNGSAVNLEGKKQVFTPDITSSLVLQYSYDISSKKQLKLIVRGEWMYLGKQYFDLANTISQDPYSIFNTRIGIAAKNFEIMFWGRNLDDTKYISYAFDFGAIHLGDPKTYGMTLTGKF